MLSKLQKNILKSIIWFNHDLDFVRQMEFQKMKLSEIKVSLIVPLYNVEKYIQQCIDSILVQTHKNIEIILVDDGAPDNSGKIADEYASKDTRIRVVHKKNGGVSSARNAGIDVSTGDYICFADGDDWLEPNYVEYLLSLVADNRAEASVTTDMFTTFYGKPSDNTHVKVCPGHEAAVDILCYNMPIGVYCKMFKRTLLDKGVRFDETLFIGEGFNFNTDAFQRADKVAIGHQRVYHYRRDNEDSAMTKFNIKKIICALKAIECIDDKIVNREPNILKALKFANWHTHCDMLFFIFLGNAEKQHEAIYSKCFRVARKDALIALFVPTSFKEKLRAIITWIYPKTIAYLMKWRRKCHVIKKRRR